jgi:DNA-binding beta-propeller fold protein YncE
VLPRLRKLEKKYDRRLAVVGVHSPKFIAERDTDAVRHAIERLNVGHPVVNDRDFRVWQDYAVRAWPTLMFVDPLGKVIAKHEGEFPYDAFDRLIGDMLAEFEAAGLLDPRPIPGAYGDRAATAEPTPLRFPGKVLADAASGRLIVSDTGHNRIVVADLDGAVRRIVGSGAEGLADGPPDDARFYQPQGLALDGGTLYVADTENHALRAVDLATGAVTTLAGTGEQLMGARVGGPPRRTPLSSPWDLALLDGLLYVAMAGTHQIWAMRPGEDWIGPHTGNGAEALRDGPLLAASMNQPSGLTHDGARVYVADSEASAIRMVEPGPGGVIRTIVGEGLFEFGDRDGVGPSEVRLQHPLGVAWHAGAVYVADTYNHKIKRLDPLTAECRTWLGGGEAAHRDGPAEEARFGEPSGLSVAGGRLYVADTNNHAVRVARLDDGAVETLELRGLEPPGA